MRNFIEGLAIIIIIIIIIIITITTTTTTTTTTLTIMFLWWDGTHFTFSPYLLHLVKVSTQKNTGM
jgi:hypothetical protein